MSGHTKGDDRQTLSAGEIAALEYLDDKMEAHVTEIGRAIRANRGDSKGGSCLPAIGAAYMGRMRKRGLVLRIPDLNAWCISQAGRALLPRVNTEKKKG